MLIVQMYDNTLGVDLHPDCRVLRLDTKAQATQNRYNRTVGECEIESELGKVSKLITHKIQLTLLAINS